MTSFATMGLVMRAGLQSTVIAIGFGCFSALAAQQTRVVQGVVRDSETRERVGFASITVPTSSLRAESNSDGRFTLLGAPLGEFELRVSGLGYRAKVVSVTTGHTGLLLIDLAPNPYELEGLTVVGDDYSIARMSDGVSKVTISPKDIALLPNVGEVDIFRSLQLLPGINGTRESSSGLYVRGGTPDQNLVLLDGMTMYHVDHFFGFFSAFNANAIKDIQVFKSAFPARYGGRTSSVIDLTGKSGDPEQMGYSAGANFLSANATFQAPLGQKATLLVTARRSFTDLVRSGLYSDIFGLYEDESSQPEAPTPGRARGGNNPFGNRFGNFAQATTTPDFYFYDVNAKATFRPTDSDVLAVSFYQGRDNLDDSRLTTQDAVGNNFSRSFSTDITNLTNWGNRGLSTTFSRQWSPRVSSKLLGAFSQYSSAFLNRTAIENRDLDSGETLLSRGFGTVEDNKIEDLTVNFENRILIGAHHVFEIGAGVTRSEVEYALVRNDTIGILDLTQEGTQLSLYAQENWSPSRRFEFSLGARFVNYDVLGESRIEPRATVRWQPKPGLTVKGAYGRHNQFVSRVVNENVTEGSRDFWLLADGDLVAPTNSEHYVAGFSWETTRYLFDVEFYRKDFTGLSEFSLRFQRGGTIDPLNLFFDGTGRAEGVEVLAQRKFGQLSGWVSYTLSNVEHTFADLNEGEPFPALHDQQHELKAVGTYSAAGWTLSSSWTGGSGTPYTAPQSEYAIELLDGSTLGFTHVGEKNGIRLPAYHRLDLSATRRFDLFGTKANVSLSVFNLYDRQNVWYREFDLSQTPVVVTDVNYLGRVLNLSINFSR